LLVLVALYFWGGPVLRDFSFALGFGVIIGTYSSIFVASPLLLIWKGSGAQTAK
jgi:preprotein translocase subunit SecF